jgi:hypothetical protein
MIPTTLGVVELIPVIGGILTILGVLRQLLRALHARWDEWRQTRVVAQQLEDWRDIGLDDGL